MLLYAMWTDCGRWKKKHYGALSTSFYVLCSDASSAHTFRRIFWKIPWHLHLDNFRAKHDWKNTTPKKDRSKSGILRLPLHWWNIDQFLRSQLSYGQYRRLPTTCHLSSFTWKIKGLRLKCFIDHWPAPNNLWLPTSVFWWQLPVHLCLCQYNRFPFPYLK